MGGPTTLPMNSIEIPKDVRSGLSLGGDEAVIITSAPLVNPAPPTPATALAAMNILLVVEMAQIRLPSSKIVMKVRKTAYTRVFSEVV